MIRLNKISKSFGDKVLFSELEFQLPAGERIALIGDNGCGKSTLLKILSQEIEPDEGELILPSNINIGVLAQEVEYSGKQTILEEVLSGAKQYNLLKNQLTESLRAIEKEPSEENLKFYEKSESLFKENNGYQTESEAKSILLGLGFKEIQLENNPQLLSGGWKMRIEMAKMFINHPEIILLDEPTNHLDLPSLVWFEKYLNSYTGTLLFVSHDKDLLNRLTTLTIHLGPGGKFTSYKGNYDDFCMKSKVRSEIEKARKETLENKKNQLEKFVTRFGAKASKAKQAQSKKKLIAKLQDEVDDILIEADTASINFKLPEPEKCSRIVVEAENLKIGYQKPITSEISFQCERKFKIAIIGANGVGKSTLLKTIGKKIPNLGGSIKLGQNVSTAYFSQSITDDLNINDSILKNVLDHSLIGDKKARNLLGSLLFSGDDVKKDVKFLSGGEKNRVGLACILAKGGNVLLLDEPTNHLDMKSVDFLSSSLASYEGTVLCVSHNRGFINSFCTHILAITSTGQCEIFSGNLNTYPALAKKSGFPNILEENDEPEKIETSLDGNNKISYKERKLLHNKRDSLQKKIEKHEELLEKNRLQIENLNTKLFDYAQNVDLENSNKVQDKINKLNQENEDLESSWLQLSDEKEELDKEISDKNAD